MKMNAIAFAGQLPKTIQTDKPTAEEDEVLVKVQYSALDTALDPVIQNTFVGGLVHKQTDPLLCGWHFSGIVEAVGSSKVATGQFEVGNEVFGHLQYDPSTTQGSLAEYITVKAGALAMKPPKISMDVAAAATTEPLTALQALRDVGKLVPALSGNSDRHVLINGAGGQVGSAAVQIAKRLGSQVTAIVSTKDVDKVRKLRADTVIDRKKTLNVMKELQRGQFDVIFDTPGKLSPAKCLAFLKPKGVYVNPTPDDLLGFLWGKVCALFSSKNVEFIGVQSKKSDLELLGKWLEDGLVVDIDSEFDVKDVLKAMERNRDSASKNGRVVIRVEDSF